jgi:ABC-type amino acid transport substrate-binding protein
MFARIPFVFSLAMVFMLAVSSIPTAGATEPLIEFTPAEKAYIAQVGTIRMCVDPDWAPFEHINPQGKHEGIAADLVQLVAQRVGLKLNSFRLRIGMRVWPHPKANAAKS